MFDILEGDERRVQREIIIHNFDWEDVDSDFRVNFNANSYCKFHHNIHSPAGRFYKDENRDIVVFHCFSEQRTFTTFDYVDLILVKEQQAYKNVWDFLIKNMDEAELKANVALAKNNIDLADEAITEQKITYINSLYNEYDDISEFINHLYLEK